MSGPWSAEAMTEAMVGQNLTGEWRELLFRPRPHTDDMIQMMADLGIEPSEMGVDYGARESWSIDWVLYNGTVLTFSRAVVLE